MFKNLDFSFIIFFYFQINTNQRYTFPFRSIIKFVILTPSLQFYNFASNMNWSKALHIPVNNIVEHGMYNILSLNSLHETDKLDKVYNRYNFKINSQLSFQWSIRDDSYNSIKMFRQEYKVTFFYISTRLVCMRAWIEIIEESWLVNLSCKLS